MKRRFLIGTLIVGCAVWLSIANSWGVSEEKGGVASQTFAIENMTCAACPITVRKAMSRVEGVESVAVDFKAKTATAIYDPQLADAATIGKASSAVGFPATLLSKAPQ